MHDTAYRIGHLAMNIYCDVQDAEILEVGSLSVNGSLRDHASSTTSYTGLDLSDGEGVDHVIELGQPFPVENDHFDLVMASSVFEHDPAFWLTFLEMCRKTKPGGYIYINAPSNGAIHRYPQDNWRFYPDCGKSLANWASSQGQHVTLIESMIANRDEDIWNDFVAVFRKGKITSDITKTSIHQNISCSNVISWRSNEIIEPRNETEDMTIIRETREGLGACQWQLSQREAEIQQHAQRHDQQNAEHQSLHQGLASLERELTLRLGEIDQISCELADARTAAAGALERAERAEQADLASADLLTECRRALSREAAQRESAEEKTEQQRLALAEETARRSETEASLVRSQERCQRLLSEIVTLQEMIEGLVEARDASMSEQSRLKQQVSAAQSATNDLGDALERSDVRLAAANAELQRLRSDFQDQSKQIDLAERSADWLRRIVSLELAPRPWWWNLMPLGWKLRRRERRLSRMGLFDQRAYLERNPDVAAEGMDPLRHYAVHGMVEDRPAQ